MQICCAAFLSADDHQVWQISLSWSHGRLIFGTDHCSPNRGRLGHTGDFHDLFEDVTAKLIWNLLPKQ